MLILEDDGVRYDWLTNVTMAQINGSNKCSILVRVILQCPRETAHESVSSILMAVRFNFCFHCVGRVSYTRPCGKSQSKERSSKKTNRIVYSGRICYPS